MQQHRAYWRKLYKYNVAVWLSVCWMQVQDSAFDPGVHLSKVYILVMELT